MLNFSMKSALAVNQRNVSYKLLYYTVANVRINSICNRIMNNSTCDYFEIILRNYVPFILFISSYTTRIRFLKTVLRLRNYGPFESKLEIN
jgi:hypothetical protein